MTKPGRWKNTCAFLVLCAATAITSPAQTFNTLFYFNGPNGGNPEYMALVQGLDGKLYGTTYAGGVNEFGTAFKITTNGSLTTLVGIGNPSAGLLLATDGNFYGTSTGGYGSVFKITAGGTWTPLHSFDGTDGSQPLGALVEDTHGDLYGTTLKGGANNLGTIFKITAAGKFTTVYSFSFCSQAFCADGSLPQAGLVLASDGNFYGTTSGGGTHTVGTVFKLTPGGKLTTVHNFNGTDGQLPTGALIQAADGNLYGTTSLGGTGCNTYGGCGTVFRITPQGELMTLYAFHGTDGTGPFAGLVQANDGTFYGTTAYGGTHAPDCSGPCGTVFEITPAGELTTLHYFAFTDGELPYGGLLQATNGVFYGTTQFGGDSTCNPPGGCGTVFSLDTGLAPFVSFVRNPAKVGQTFGVLGQGLTGTTSVSLNGNSATFRVLSNTFLEATVPAGSTTGPVTVTTPSGTLSRNVPFRVLK